MWKKIINELLKGGWSEKSIGDHVGVNQSTINRLKHKVIPEPPHSVGESLIALHKTEMRKRK